MDNIYSTTNNQQGVKQLANDLQPISSLRDEFARKCQNPGQRLSTGFLPIDVALSGGLQNELYILAAESSTGKSALMMAIAQNLAQNGINVLYFSLEMSPAEFIARGTSLISFEHYLKDKNSKKFTFKDILTYEYDHITNQFTRLPYSSYESYVQEYFDRYESNLYIISGGLEGFSAKDVANIAAVFKNSSQNPVVVFVDYMQLLHADRDDRSQVDRKTRADENVRVLKSLSSQYEMPVFAASSISRKSYDKKITLDSLKESGDIEYTGGVIIAWNWLDVLENNMASYETRADARKECNKRGYRTMAFDVIKNRNAIRDIENTIYYVPAYNYFSANEPGIIT